MTPLTRRQQAIYDFIVRQVRREGIPPTLMEIADNFGLSSAASVSDHLKAIERKGFIRRRPGASRGIEVSALRDARQRDGAVRVAVRGDVPSARSMTAPARARTMVVDRSLADGELVALRTATRALERRGILEGDVLIIDVAAQSQPGDLVVGVQRGKTLLMEMDGSGRGAHPVAGRVSGHDEVELLGPVVAVVRAARRGRA
jgi:repressor LexA